MKQRYNKLDHALCVRAVLEAFDGKWLRGDVIQLVNKYGGVAYGQLRREQQTGECWAKLEAAEGIAFELEQRIEDLMNGDPDALDLEPVHAPRTGRSGPRRSLDYWWIPGWVAV